MQKRTYFALSCALVLIGIVSVYFWWRADHKQNTESVASAPVETSNIMNGADIPSVDMPDWKIVQDASKRVTIKIPIDWYSEVTISDGYLVELSNYPIGSQRLSESLPDNFVDIDLGVGGHTLPANTDLYKWHETFAPQLYDKSETDIRVEHLNLAGIKAVVEHSKNNLDSYYISKESMVIRLLVSCSNLEYCALAKQVLGTVRL